jgi:hypothetical protein
LFCPQLAIELPEPKEQALASEEHSFSAGGTNPC